MKKIIKYEMTQEEYAEVQEMIAAIWDVSEKERDRLSNKLNFMRSHGREDMPEYKDLVQAHNAQNYIFSKIIDLSKCL